MRSGECRFFNGVMAKKDAPENFILSSDNLTNWSNKIDVKKKRVLQWILR